MTPDMDAEKAPLSDQAGDLDSPAVFVSPSLFLAAWIPRIWQYFQPP